MAWFRRTRGHADFRDRDVYSAEIRDRRAKRKRFLMLNLAALLAGLFAILGAWAVLYSPLFRVAQIEVEGVQETDPDAIRNFLDRKVLEASLVNVVLGSRNMLAWDEETTASYAPELPRVREIAVTKSYFERTVRVQVSERAPFGIWCAVREEGVESCAWFDKEGVLLEQAPHASGNLIPVVSDYSGKYLRSQTKVHSERAIHNIITVFDALRAAGVSVREVRLLDRELEEVTVLLNGGPALYFSVRFPATETGQVLASLMEQGGNGTAFRNFEYVDFRVEHRAYYK